MAAALRGLVSAAAVAWMTTVGLTVVRVSPGDAAHWVGPVLTVTVAVAITTTLAAVVLHCVPRAVDAYWSGVRHGQRVAELDAEPRRSHLRPVR